MRNLIAVCSLALAFSPVVLPATGSVAEPAPNILLLMLEDLGPRFGSKGDPLTVTPNIDRRAAEGVRFANVHTTAGVCAPSRAAVPPPHVKAFGRMGCQFSNESALSVN